MKRFVLGILMVVAIPLSLRAQTSPEPAKAAQSISLLFSSNLHGEVEPCG